MKLFELTSGFIAAVLIALGAYQYVNRATVEEESVVTEAVNKVANLHWFSVNESTGALTYAGTGPEDILGCNEQEPLEGYIYCSVAFETMTPPATNISAVIADPSLAEDARYKEPEN